jgi:hypothetical protein
LAVAVFPLVAVVVVLVDFFGSVLVEVAFVVAAFFPPLDFGSRRN